MAVEGRSSGSKRLFGSVTASEAGLDETEMLALPLVRGEMIVGELRVLVGAPGVKPGAVEEFPERFR